MSLFHDLRHALRSLRMRPGFLFLASVMMALGIGANTAIFSVVDGVLLRPLPFADGDRLAFITRSGDVSISDGVDWRAQSETFEEIALFLRGWSFDLTGDGEPRRLNGSVVEPELFSVLRVEPLLGRTLEDADNRLGGERVAVISEGLWRRHFGAAPDAVGRELVLSDQPTTVVGVMPAELDFLELDVDLWVPVAVETPWAIDQRGTNNFDAIGRLRPGVGIEEAQAEMKAISERLAAAYPDTNSGKIVNPIPLRVFLTGNVRQALWLLLGAVGLLLLVACGNLVSLLLARSIVRRREVATRLSLGAPRRRIVQQMVGEGLVLAGVGGALGTLLAFWGKDLLLSLAPAGLPRAAEIAIDGRVLGFALALSLLAGVGVSLVPALRVLRRDPASALGAGRAAAIGRDGQRFLAALVTAEVALAVVLLVGCGLLARSLYGLYKVDLGFEARDVLFADVVLPESRYSAPAAQSAAFRDAVAAIDALPGVVAAASVIGTPLRSFGTIGHRALVEDRPAVEPGTEPGAANRPVVGEYFRALGQPILEGRAFTPSDDADAPPVAIVNRSFARELWPDASPIGKRISWKISGEEPRWMTIVGVTADIKSASLQDDDGRAVYTPYLQRTATWQRFGTLVVRTEAEPAGFARAVREAVWTVDPTLPLAGVETLRDRLASSLAQQRFNTQILGFFAAVTLLLATLGIYGLLAFAVEQRRRELGVRMVLGAGRGELLRGVIGRGMALAAAGLAAGLAGTFALGKVVEGLLYGVEPGDGPTLLTVAVAVGAAAFLGCYLPAERASRIDPVVALRHE